MKALRKLLGLVMAAALATGLIFGAIRLSEAGKLGKTGEEILAMRDGAESAISRLTELFGKKDKGVPEETPAPEDDLSWVPEYCGMPYAEINGNMPFFEESEKTTEAFERYSELDSFGRCGAAFANICEELMPTEEREDISEVHPSGYRVESYPDLIEDEFLWNRCHLIAFMLAGENSNERNLITGTRHMNVEGMLPFETAVAYHIYDNGGHVLYRVTPIFEGNDLVARGVLMEAYSVEDEGAGVCFCVFCYNVQPGIVINYSDGRSRREE